MWIWFYAIYHTKKPVIISYPENEHGEIGLVNIPEEVEALCGAKIISYEYDEPIENEYGLFK